MKEKNIIKEMYKACIEGDTEKQQDLIQKQYKKIFKRKEQGKKFSTKWMIFRG